MIEKAAFAGARAHLALPLMAGALVGACRSEAEPVANAAPQAPAPAAPSAAELAQRLVRDPVGGGDAVAFGASQIFSSQGATIMCGRFSRAGQAERRFIVIGEEDVFVEDQMRPGHMDQAAGEFCRNA